MSLWVRLHVFGSSLTPLDLTIDLRDAVGDRLHLSDDFVKEGVSAEPSTLYTMPCAMR
jgi:hypothetical protein